MLLAAQNIIDRIFGASVANGYYGTDRKGRFYILRPKAHGMGKLERFYPNKDGKTIAIWGEYEVKNGPGKCRVMGCGCGMMHQIGHNKITGQGLRHLMNWAIILNTASNRNMQGFSVTSLNNMRLGTGTGATTDSTTTLQAEIATAPNSITSSFDNPSSGIYRTTLTSTWNAGTLSAVTVTEIGIKIPHLYGISINNASITSDGLLSRLSTSDSEMTSFLINAANPLVVAARIVFTFV